MSTHKQTGPGGLDVAMPEKGYGFPPPARCCIDEPIYPPIDWRECDFYPADEEEPVPMPHHFRPFGRKWYPYPRPEKIDGSSKKLARLSQKAKVLVQMIKDFEQKNKPVIITIGGNSYQFGTKTITDFEGESAEGMYSSLICADSVVELQAADYTVDDSQTRVALKNPTDLLQSELARVRKEITLAAEALSNEVTSATTETSNIPGTGE